MTTVRETTETMEAAPAGNAAAPDYTGETFVLGSNLDHNRVVYPEGTRVSGSVFTADEFAHLRRAGILRFESEVAAAEDLAAKARAQQAALDAAQAQIEELRRQLAEAKTSAGTAAGSKSK